jgi:hypothetical protein
MESEAHAHDAARNMDALEEKSPAAKALQGELTEQSGKPG